jgi:hypothetical protein
VKVRVVNVRRVARLGLVAASALLLFGGAGSAEARTADATQPKVVVIVGPAGDATPYYRRLAEQTATAASAVTPNVVRIYSPDATWERVRAALQGASVVVYLGHGNGWPSIYHDSLYPATEDGFGLNPESGAADAHQYFGEDRIAAEIKLAPNAVVVFSHLCYASGNSEPGLPEGTLDVAQQRVDNYAAGFFKAGAGAVIADAYLSPEYYVTSILRGRGTIDSIWRGAPDRNGNFLTFESARTKGAVASMDPERADSGFVRSLVARPGLRSADVLAGSGGASGEPLPAPEPSLIGLGVAFGSPGLGGPPTAGSTMRYVIPMTPAVAAVVPTDVKAAVRWDRLDPPDAEAATPPADAPPGGPALVVPEVPGEVVAPVPTGRLKRGAITLQVRLPASPGLYRLVSSLHAADGLAYDAATQALVPAVIVRVVGATSASYQVQSTADMAAGAALTMPVAVTNLGTSPWGRAAGPRSFGPGGLVAGVHASLVTRWVPLGLPDDSTTGASTTVALPAGLPPGATAGVEVAVTAPRVAGEWLLVLDVVDADGTSLAGLGVPPGTVRVSVGG